MEQPQQQQTPSGAEQPQQQQYNIHRKKIRTNLQPSKVLFLRRLPHQCNENEIEAVVDQDTFGQVKIVSLKNSKVGFVEFESIDKASSFLKHACHDGQLKIRDRFAEVDYSERKELVPPPQQSKPMEPNYIIHITVEGAQYPVRAGDLFKRFQQYGQIDKIVCFASQSNVQQGLVQFREVNSAKAGKDAENGTTIYKSCTLRIDFSKLQDLTVKFNNDRTRDYTKQLPHGHHQRDHDHRRRGGRREGPVLVINNLSSKTTCDELFTLLGVYGDVETVKIIPHKPENALVEFTNNWGADNTLFYLRDAIPLHSRNITVSRSKHMYIRQPTQQQTPGYKNYQNHPHHRFKNQKGNKSFKNATFPSTVLHVSNLNGTVEKKDILEIFGKYAQVENVIFFGEKTCMQDGEQISKKMALVQLSSLSGAVRALIHCHVRLLKDLRMRVSFSYKKIGDLQGDQQQPIQQQQPQQTQPIQQQPIQQQPIQQQTIPPQQQPIQQTQQPPIQQPMQSMPPLQQSILQPHNGAPLQMQLTSMPQMQQPISMPPMQGQVNFPGFSQP